MSYPTLVIVSGLPASGKTTLARRLEAELRLPLIVRDDIKERLFDSLGWSDRAWSQRLGEASWELLYWAVETQLTAEQSCIVESNFDPAIGSAEINGLRERIAFRAIQVHCYAEGRVLVARYLARVTSGQRHLGHVDHITIDEKRDQLLTATPQPLTIDGKTLIVDTTHPVNIDYDWILAEIRSMMAEDG